MATITDILAREILDSRGWPTVEAEVRLNDGTVGRASVPSGASTGEREALELRDGDPGRFRGRGVRLAVANVRDHLAGVVRGLEATDQAAVDGAMTDLDGTPNRGRLGANGILAVSLATARAAAASRGVPLWQHLNEALFPGREPSLPLPMVNILSGGHHAGFQLDIQDVLIVPAGATSTMQMVEWTNAVYYAVRDILRAEAGYTQLVADEGGFGPALESNERALDIVNRGIAAAGLEPGREVVLALDVAASHFYQGGAYMLAADRLRRDARSMIDVLESWVDTYPVRSIEDGLAENDWDHWVALTQRLGDRAQVIGDDLFTTNVAQLRRGIERGIANSILVKVNQIGTLSESAEACRTAFAAGYTAVISTRSGETEDDFVSDLAVASGAGQIKPGSLARSERTCKFNRLLRIEEQLGAAAFTGRQTLARWL